MMSRSCSHSSQLLQALPDGSRKTVGDTLSRNQVSLVLLSPSFWCPAVETPQRKEFGKFRWGTVLLDDVGGASISPCDNDFRNRIVRTGTARPRSASSPTASR